MLMDISIVDPPNGTILSKVVNAAYGKCSATYGEYVQSSNLVGSP